MKQRIDYYTPGARHPIKLSAYGRRLLAAQPGSYSDTITAALQRFLGSRDHILAAQLFIAENEGMNFSLLVELALVYCHHRPPKLP